ncbi:hypothetical protein A6A04_15485 [Paramagnetospirillum marisnigri]|uniref:Divergent polysaccharide deacetylase family protein n=1 Tax=Paramagnetospirillum marisnigri TaxID=1285242 RepID=A0A178MV29_9PROT|nr:divergent polysaccharide deacetylase family protein [Paramagnetospirillum marisnigri]OAN52900.1 hypothetical protein A6A04_15485 [Paramagnetospirillum marisnigri]
MGRKDVRRMLMGRKQPLWERPWVLVALMVAVLVVGVAVGLGVGRWSSKPPPGGSARMEQAPAPVIGVDPAPAPRSSKVEEEPEDTRPLIQPPPPRPDPGSTEALELGHASDVVVVTRPSAPPAPMAKLAPPGAAVWLRHAVPAPKVQGRPMIAVIIDDLGVDRRRSERMAALKAPLTLSYMTYADDLARQTADARAHGHELMVHVPMQPQSASYDPGPEVLEVGLSAEEIRRRLDWGLSRFDGYVGINNHMGSRFTSEAAGMRVVMEELRRRGLVWVDSVTSERTVGADLARQFGIPFATRHIFLDNDQGVAHVRAQLAKTEAHARKHGFAIAIGHPHDGTIEALAGWIGGLEAKGLVLVPVSAIIKSAPNG